MAKDGITITEDRLSEVMDNVEALAMMDVLVGIPEIETERSDDDDGMITNAALAYIHENGAPEANIPARPFIHPGIEDVKGKIAYGFRKVAELQLEGNASGANKGLHAIGLTAQSAVKKRIFTGPFKPLKASTLRARKTRKIAPRLGDRPLIDTGQMLNAVSYIVREGGDNGAT